jgi:LPXTG-motif cell wall-anchored protein
MKKAIALLVAVAAAFSINVGALAALTFAGDTSDTHPTLTAGTGQLVLGYSAAGGHVAVLPETFLQPGREYRYQLFRVDQDYTSVAPNNIAMTPVNDTMLDGAKLRIRTIKGSTNVVSAKIEKKGSGATAIYNFVVETKETYGTKVNDLEYGIIVSGQPANTANRLLDATVLFRSGYRAMLDEEIDYYAEGDTVTIPTDRPVITKKQFETLAKNYNYKAVTFMGEDGDWTFTGRVSGMGDANFLTTYDVIPEIINAFPEQDYKFITFNAGVTFPTNGELRLDVSDIRDTTVNHLDRTNHGLHAYLYRNGVLTPIATTYDNTSDEIVFRTNYLGGFVVTNAEITGFTGEIVEPTLPNENIVNNEATHNPPTGAASATGVIVLGLASLASAGVIARKKTKK